MVENKAEADEHFFVKLKPMSLFWLKIKPTTFLLVEAKADDFFWLNLKAMTFSWLKLLPGRPEYIFPRAINLCDGIPICTTGDHFVLRMTNISYGRPPSWAPPY